MVLAADPDAMPRWWLLAPTSPMPSGMELAVEQLTASSDALRPASRRTSFLKIVEQNKDRNMGYNRAEFIGNLGADARIAQVGDQTVANFRIAVNERRGKEEIVTWVGCALWGKTADSLGQYLVKGKQVLVAGPIQIEEYTKKDTGETTHSLSVNVRDITLLGGGARESEDKPAPTEENPFAKRK